MKQTQLQRIQHGKGFIAALDQSGGSTPKALSDYGITKDQYSSEEDMYRLVHEMRKRIILCPAFNDTYILGAILFENTIDRNIEGELTADYLWNKKKIVPFLKIDKGLAETAHGVQLMKPIPELDQLLKRAHIRNIFGTKMRSLIHEANPDGISQIVAQQFEVAEIICQSGLVPIIEPEVDIHSSDRAKSESLLKDAVIRHLSKLDHTAKVMFKFSIPVEDNFYSDLMNHPCVIRIVALSGGYSQAEANKKLSSNRGLIASFSRALVEGLTAQQADIQFNETLSASIKAIFEASKT